MSSQLPNTTCRTCGKKYYACEGSRELGGYKMVACSHECYQEYMKQVLLARDEEIPKELQVSNLKTEDVDIEVGVEDETSKPKDKKSKK